MLSLSYVKVFISFNAESLSTSFDAERITSWLITCVSPTNDNPLESANYNAYLICSYVITPSSLARNLQLHLAFLYNLPCPPLSCPPPLSSLSFFPLPLLPIYIPLSLSLFSLCLTSCGLWTIGCPIKWNGNIDRHHSRFYSYL